VQAGDNLNRIALKLYGNANKWQAIYDLNKEAIGNDRRNSRQRAS
jgi:nucleoid-associated protein YgaU